MRRVAAALIWTLLLAACTTAGHASSPLTVIHPTPSTATADPAVPRPVTSAPVPTPRAPPSRSRSAHTEAGSGRILGRERVVAYYGVPNNKALGVLGSAPPERIAPQIIRRAAQFRGYGRPVQPAMELVATVAQGAPGPTGRYSKPVPAPVIAHYLEVAHAYRMLLILDLQPGRSTFLAQARALRPFLLDPSVSLALDPEWQVGPGQKPGGGRIGASSAAGINAVGSWLSALIRAHHLPDKLLIVHQFTRRMLPDRERITQHRNVEMVLHADGFGTPAAKISTFDRLAFPHPPFGVGFKLFLTHDRGLMSPAEVMALRPRPAVITYQ
ncbi:MAG TPA: hypothetical protein VFU35_02830 [Jatrophihabitans sp.]|nr:hypothetical protein [Jatrophihabitans sp.]